MESHPLNLAHQQHRKADAFLKSHRYDEAIQCHHNATELLLDAMKSTTSSVALESLNLQYNYHLKQKELVKNRKERYLRLKKAMNNAKCSSVMNINNSDKETTNLLDFQIQESNEGDNFSTLSILTGFSSSSSLLGSVTFNKPFGLTGSDKLIQQPNFDLSALKNDSL